MTHSPRPFPCAHRNIEEDGVRVEKDQGQRVCYVLATCRDCGQRLEQPWQMRRGGGWRVDRGVAPKRESA